MAAESDDLRAEDALVQAARGGDRSALNALAERNQQRVFGFGMKMCGDAEDAQEVARESLLTMVRSLRDFRGDATISTWLYTVARSFCIKKRRRTKGAPAHHDPRAMYRSLCARLCRRPWTSAAERASEKLSLAFTRHETGRIHHPTIV